MIRFNKEKRCCNAPYSVNVSVTERCPLRCPFCFHEYNQFRELDYQTICNYIDELAFLGTVQLQFSGGEPLVYPHLLEIISYAHLKGLYTMISSSGIGMSVEVAESLKRVGLDRCHISLNGSKKEIHELTRDGYEYAIQAIEVLSKSNLKSAINWVAYHENVRDLPRLIAWAKSFNVQYISILPMKKNNANMILNQMNEDDFAELVYYCNKHKGYLIVDSCFKELNDAIKGNKFLTEGCRAGRFYMAINVSGEFLGCPHLSEKGMKYSSINEYWNEDRELKRQRKESACSCVYHILNNSAE